MKEDEVRIEIEAILDNNFERKDWKSTFVLEELLALMGGDGQPSADKPDEKLSARALLETAMEMNKESVDNLTTSPPLKEKIEGIVGQFEIYKSGQKDVYEMSGYLVDDILSLSLIHI